MLPTYLSDPDTETLASPNAPGQLLEELELRQDEVLEQLDELEAKIRSVLQGLNVEMIETDIE